MNPLRRFTQGLRSSLLVRNIVANLFGRVWMMAMSFGFVPIYIRLVGIEAYGVIGLYATLMALFSVLDFGLSVTLNRELSRMVAIESEHARMPDLVRTLEVFYWAIGLVIGAIIVAAAPYIARHWLHPTHISIPTLETTIRLIGVTAALQWPTGLYGGGIAGLQQFVRSNLIDILVSTLRGVGGLVALLLFASSLEAYFIWQVIATSVGLMLMHRLMWRSLPRSTGRARVDLAMFKGLWRFSLGMTFIALLGVLIGQTDKVLLSAVVPLAVYAKYLLGGALATATGIVSATIIPTLLPQLSQSVLIATVEQTTELYHRFCQLIALTILPVAVTVAAFSYEIILFWTGDADIARVAAPVASILTLGAACTGLFQLPYLLQLANGATRPSLIANIVAAVAIVPVVYGLTVAFGIPGTAAGISLIAFVQLFSVAPYLHATLLPGNNRRWLLHDIAVPAIVAGGTVALLRTVAPTGLSRVEGFAVAGAAGAVTLLATLLCLPSVRSTILRNALARFAKRRAAIWSAGDA